MPRSIIIYAESGDTKTTQLWFLAKWIRQKTGKRIRLIAGDPGGEVPFVDSGMIERKEVELLKFHNRVTALADCKRLSEGYWPRTTKDGKEYFKSDEHCYTSAEKFKEIGAYLIEGFTPIGKLLLSHCSKQEEGIGFKHSYKYEEDGYTIGGLQEGHYGLVQKQLYEMHVQGFANLPVDYVIWTALVGKGEKKRTGETVYGPQLCGNATTAEVPTWFHECFHLQEIQEEVIDAQGQTRMGSRKVAWFVNHLDKEAGIPYLARTRALPEVYGELIRQFPGGRVNLGLKRGLEVFYEKMEEITKNGNRA